METTSKRSSSAGRSGLKHRITRMLLLHSSCSASAADLVELSRSTLPRQEPEDYLQCRSCDADGRLRTRFAQGTSEKERRLTENGELYETSERDQGRKCPPASSSSSARNRRRRFSCPSTGKGTRKLLSNNAYGFSSSSCSSDCDEEEESGILLSSRSFSSDSSDFYCNSKGRRRKKKKRPIACREAGYAVVKKSSDPYMDFRSSMVEMIVEKQISRARDMEKLLCSYLSLNSPLHHPVILEAFADIWEAVLYE
ncbi:transcription repressor OFP1-like [Canna indica]|uniref:Transcription repressor n=1 Tax=Canna indica TaxID=4628 RepID=A0AAQ3KTI1_9LILI|nr:transcription repressor OFP1-like [Canna indica]